MLLLSFVSFWLVLNLFFCFVFLIICSLYLTLFRSQLLQDSLFILKPFNPHYCDDHLFSFGESLSHRGIYHCLPRFYPLFNMRKANDALKYGYWREKLLAMAFLRRVLEYELHYYCMKLSEVQSLPQHFGGQACCDNLLLRLSTLWMCIKKNLSIWFFSLVRFAFPSVTTKELFTLIHYRYVVYDLKCKRTEMFTWILESCNRDQGTKQSNYLVSIKYIKML